MAFLLQQSELRQTGTAKMKILQNCTLSLLLQTNHLETQRLKTTIYYASQFCRLTRWFFCSLLDSFTQPYLAGRSSGGWAQLGQMAELSLSLHVALHRGLHGMVIQAVLIEDKDSGAHISHSISQSKSHGQLRLKRQGNRLHSLMG